MITRPLAVLIAALLVSGCATSAAMDGIMSSWKGENIAQAVKRWGSADQRSVLHGGQAAYTWTEGGTYTRGGSALHLSQTSPTGLTVGSTTYAPPETAYRGCTRTLYVDAKGTITAATWSGSACCEQTPCSAWSR